MFIPFSKEQKRTKSLMPFPYSFKGVRNRAAASKLARLIDPAYSNRDWLICQPVKTHFLTEPTSYFIGRLRNPIRSSAAKCTRDAPHRQPLFLKIFRFLSKPLILLGEIDVEFLEIPLARPLESHRRDTVGYFRSTIFAARNACFRPIFALSACVFCRVPYAVPRRARTHFARASKG